MKNNRVPLGSKTTIKISRESHSKRVEGASRKKEIENRTAFMMIGTIECFKKR